MIRDRTRGAPGGRHGGFSVELATIDARIDGGFVGRPEVIRSGGLGGGRAVSGEPERGLAPRSDRNWGCGLGLRDRDGCEVRVGFVLPTDFPRGRQLACRDRGSDGIGVESGRTLRESESGIATFVAGGVAADEVLGDRLTWLLAILESPLTSGRAMLESGPRSDAGRSCCRPAELGWYDSSPTLRLSAPHPAGGSSRTTAASASFRAAGRNRERFAKHP